MTKAQIKAFNDLLDAAAKRAEFEIKQLKRFGIHEEEDFLSDVNALIDLAGLVEYDRMAAAAKFYRRLDTAGRDLVPASFHNLIGF